jgi:hypothetical protein
MRFETIGMSCFLLSALPAQQVPLGDGGRLLQVFDLDDLRPDRAKGPDLVVVAAGENADAKAAQQSTEGCQRLAAFVARFVEPPLQPDDDVQVLGRRWLTVLGSPKQIASVERLLATARARRTELIGTEVHLLEMPAAAFTAHVAGLLAKPGADGATRAAVLSKQAATELLDAVVKGSDSNVLSAPRVVAAPLHVVTMSVGEQVSYIKDFAIETVGGQLIANPIIDQVFDGLHIDLLCTYTGKDKVGLQCAVLQQELAKPIAEFETALGVTGKVKVQLPRTTGVRLEQTAELELGSAVLIAADKKNGTWLVALVVVDRSPQ